MQEALMPRWPWMAGSGPAAIRLRIAAGSRSYESLCQRGSGKPYSGSANAIYALPCSPLGFLALLVPITMYWRPSTM